MKTKELILCALFIALITAGTFIKIPVGTDVYTLQFLFTLLAGLLLGPKLGAIAVGTYTIMGLVGIPVFAEGGGPGYIAQPTFGYLLGFIVQAAVNGWLARRTSKVRFSWLLAADLAGMAVVYFFGLVWFYVISNYFIDAPITVWAVVWYCGILQVLPDFLLCVAASLIGVRCYKAGIWLAPASVQEKVDGRYCSKEA
jgi:biotin transport system substrate-specific component